MISIITPTYNHEKYIGECIQSVLNQTFQDWEMIIVDDGSTDKTAEVVSQFKDPRIRYFRQGHVGPWKLAETYNFALSKSSGEYIAILEGDDYWPSNKLEIQYAEMESHKEAILSYGKSMMVSDLGRELGYFELPEERAIITNNPVGSSLHAFFELKLFIQAVTLLIRRSSLDKIGGFQKSNIIPAVDYPTTLRLCLEGVFLPIHATCLGYWRRHMNSISTNYQIEALKGMANHNLDFYDQHEEDIFKLNFQFKKTEIMKRLEQRLNIASIRYYYHSGFLFVALREYPLAKQMFLKYLAYKPKWREKIIVYLGLLSCFLEKDLIYPCIKVRDKFKKCRLIAPISTVVRLKNVD